MNLKATALEGGGLPPLAGEGPEIFRDLFEDAAFGMVIVDRDGDLLLINAAFRRFLGFDRTEKLRLNLFDLVPEETRFDLNRWFSREAPEEAPVFNGELPFLRRDRQSVAWGQTTMTCLPSGRPRSPHFVVLIQDVTERKLAEEEIRRLAYNDILTGLPNRTLFKDRLTQALARMDRDDGSVGVLFLDLDRFKRVNDTLGHRAGDLLLKEVAGRLRSCVRRGDTVARLGGDEFVVIAPGLQGVKGVAGMAQKVLEALARPFEVEGEKVHTSTSIGIALAPADGKDADTLLRHADMAMYDAKDRGRNGYQFFAAEMNRKAAERHELEKHLRRALQQDEFFLLYHPQLDLESGSIVGVEALLRWKHPTRGTLLPTEFLPLAEETGLILPIDVWVLTTACRQAREWERIGGPPLRIAVNISARQFNRPGFVHLVRQVLQDTELEPCRLELELTESLLMDNLRETGAALSQLKQLGVLLAIDDFGTGYSSLGCLKHLPIDRLKIAQTFVQEIDEPANAVIVDAIVAMARSLGLHLIAEGVETLEQLRFLRSLRCQEMQGFYFSQPIPADAFTRYVREGLAGPEACFYRITA